MTSDKWAVGIVLAAAAWFWALPSIDRWHTEPGAARRDFMWRGEATAETVDSLGQKVEPGIHILYVMSDCQSCSYKSIPRQSILDRAARDRVIVAFQNRLPELDKGWRMPTPNIRVFELGDFRMPPEWSVRAPFAGKVNVSSRGGGLRIAAAEK